MGNLAKQLRAMREPADFIRAAKQALRPDQDAYAIEPEHFGTMTRRIFDTVTDTTGREFSALRDIAQHSTQRLRLNGPFYRAVQEGVTNMQVRSGDYVQNWASFFMHAAPASRSDPQMIKIIRDQVVAKELPALVFAVDQDPAAVDAATGIIKALGDVPEAIGELDADVVTEIVRAQIRNKGGHVPAAPVLTELRATPVFAGAIAAHENATGSHVVTYRKSTARPGETYARTHLIALEFDRDAGSVNAYRLERTLRGYRPELIMNGNGICTQAQAAVADALLEHTYADLPGQDWVHPIAENAALRLG